MRSTLLLLVAWAACAQAQQQPDAGPAPDGKTEAARASEAAVDTRRAAESYAITAAAPEGKGVLRLEPGPLLQWSNPVLGSFHGSVFVWTAKGRPAVIASIYKKYVPPPHLGVDFHTMSAGPVTAERDGHPEWFPDRGLEPEPVPGAPAPASSPAGRSRQVRDLARQFTATKTDRKEITRSLRLLTQPVYRYGTPDSDVLDGALFAFVEGTDPEVFLLIEARRGAEGLAWYYAMARMNSIALRVAHAGREVWAVPTIPWQQAFNPREPYTLLIFRPGSGVNPPEDSPRR
jgi:hypothetical protein